MVENAEEPREIARIVLPQSQSNADESVVRPVGEEDDAIDRRRDSRRGFRRDASGGSA